MDNDLLLTIKKFAIETEPVYSLKECLKLSKERQELIVENNEIKEELGDINISDALYGMVAENFIFNYIFFNNDQNEAFLNLIENRKLELDHVIYGGYYFLYCLGIAYYFYSDEKLYCIIPDEIIEIYNNRDIEKVKEQRDFCLEFYKYTVALCNLYGVFEAEQFVEVYNTYHRVKTTVEEYLDYVKVMGNRQMYFSIELNDEGDSCLIYTGEKEDSDELVESLFTHMEIGFFMPTRSLINHYFENAFEDTYEFIKFKNYILDNKLIPKERH